MNPPVSLRRALVVGVLALLTLGPLGACADDESGSVEAFCDQIAVTPPLATVVSAANDADPTELGASLSRAEEAYSALRSAAPSEIRDDVDEVVDLVEVLLQALTDHGDDPELVAAELRREVIDHPDAATAATAVADFAQRECGLELNPTVDDGDR